jgi:hypothetical protein
MKNQLAVKGTTYLPIASALSNALTRHKVALYANAPTTPPRTTGTSPVTTSRLVLPTTNRPLAAIHAEEDEVVELVEHVDVAVAMPHVAKAKEEPAILPRVMVANAAEIYHGDYDDDYTSGYIEEYDDDTTSNKADVTFPSLNKPSADEEATNFFLEGIRNGTISTSGF